MWKFSRANNTEYIKCIKKLGYLVLFCQKTIPPSTPPPIPLPQFEVVQNCEDKYALSIQFKEAVQQK